MTQIFKLVKSSNQDHRIWESGRVTLLKILQILLHDLHPPQIFKLFLKVTIKIIEVGKQGRCVPHPKFCKFHCTICVLPQMLLAT